MNYRKHVRHDTEVLFVEAQDPEEQADCEI